MAKIGVYTFDFTSDNYGQVLQYLATQEYLKTLGHQATLLSMQGRRPTLSSKVRWMLRRIARKLCGIAILKSGSKDKDNIAPEIDEKKALFAQWAACTQRQEQEAPRHFEDFRNQFFSRQKGYYETFCESGYDAYCVGSDQTWSYMGYDNMFGWTPDKAKRFTLAASLGHSKYTDNQISGVEKYLHRFDFVTVREDNGLEFCRRAGYQRVSKVLDPTFLLPSVEYDKYAEEINTEKPYIFVYLLGGEISISMSGILQKCETLGYDVKYVESQGRDEAVEKIPATVGQWLGLMRKASYVLTNSFHGLAFSLIYHKPMIVFPLVGIMKDMNGRIEDLSKQMGIEERVYDNDFSVLSHPVDWERIDSIIERNRIVTTELVQATLGEDCVGRV